MSKGSKTDNYERYKQLNKYTGLKPFLTPPDKRNPTNNPLIHSQIFFCKSHVSYLERVWNPLEHKPKQLPAAPKKTPMHRGRQGQARSKKQAVKIFFMKRR